MKNTEFIKLQRKAAVLAFGEVYNRAAAMAEFKISESTYYEYRQQLDRDQKLFEIFQAERSRLLKELTAFTGEYQKALVSAARKLSQLILTVKPDNYQAILPISKSVEIMGNLVTAQQVLNDE